MVHYDVFNGDADGIFSRHQLRLTYPKKAILITGVKRDTNLLRKINPKEGDFVTVLDISHNQNRKDVLRILGTGANLEYFDHHDPGELINHPNITYHINTEPNMTTGLIVDSYVSNKNHIWSIATAFGDNHIDLALAMSKGHNLKKQHTALLQQISLLVNYNSYGKTVADLFYTPEQITSAVEQCGANIFKFIKQGDIFKTIKENYNSDMRNAMLQKPYSVFKNGTVYTLPDEIWSHRIMGTFSNLLATSHRDKACAVAVLNSDDTYRISVRASLMKPYGAGNLCKLFGGGGREKAGGINNLKNEEFEFFNAQFYESFA